MAEDLPNTNDDKKGEANPVKPRRAVAEKSNAILQIVLLFAILVAINYLAMRHPDYFNPANWVSKKKQISWDFKSKKTVLSDQTLTLLKNLKEDVKVIVVFNTSNELFMRVEEMLKQYDAHSDHIKLQIVDRDRDLGKVSEMVTKYRFNPEEQAGVIIFERGDSRQIVNATDLPVRSASGVFGQNYDMTGFKGEQYFTSALLTVTSSKPVKAYVLMGHGEISLQSSGLAGYSRLNDFFKLNNFSLQPLKLQAQSQIPDDCDVLLILGPEAEFQANEVAAIEAYLKKQGNLFITLQPRVRTGLEKLIGSYGVKLQNDILLTHLSDGNMTYLVYTKTEGGHPIVKRMNELNVSPVFTTTRTLSLQPPAPEIVPQPTPTVILSAEEGYWGELGPIDEKTRPDDKDIMKGPHGVAIAIESGAMPGTGVDVKGSKIIVVGSTLFLANQMTQNQPNKDFLFNSLNWMIKRNELIGISPTPVEQYRLTLSPQQRLILLTFVLLGLPLIIGVTGFIVWFRRRK